ncbi:hypothetical protein SAMN04488128_103236 [Chitinophaga eiseniae]|uniref:DUF551 domain-containing protein n=1 Tax=Chitinophaga eiseniae TaxID=634771 RepID=A0A1T4SPJ6_9BACT|nr:hypothetical protein [Chitinophaga eiseniae]SKA30190.1 hypothetical protein SAMN04488128_103236 [Chitinophaga eiseniae]
MTTLEQKQQAATSFSISDGYEHGAELDRRFIAGAEWAEAQQRWIPVAERVPEAIDGKVYPVLCLNGKHRVICYYFPEHFKTVEWEDWDDYNPEWFPYTEEDAEKGVVWLRPGFYQEVECDKCDGYWSSPLPITAWQPLPPAQEGGQDVQ